MDATNDATAQTTTNSSAGTESGCIARVMPRQFPNARPGTAAYLHFYFISHDHDDLSTKVAKSDGAATANSPVCKFTKKDPPNIASKCTKSHSPGNAKSISHAGEVTGKNGEAPHATAASTRKEKKNTR